MEKRFTSFSTELKTRSDKDQKILEGYFIVFNQKTELCPGILEVIAQGAVNKSIENNDIRALFNHDNGTVLGRVGNQTLELKADDHGLWGKIVINPLDREANDIYARVERGDINECSFGFFEVDTEIIRDKENDTTTFIVKEADVHEVSIVSWGAYPTTEISARSRFDEVEKMKEQEVRERKSRIKKLREKYGKES